MNYIVIVMFFDLLCLYGSVIHLQIPYCGCLEDFKKTKKKNIRQEASLKIRKWGNQDPLPILKGGKCVAVVTKNRE